MMCWYSTFPTSWKVTLCWYWIQRFACRKSNVSYLSQKCVKMSTLMADWLEQKLYLYNTWL